MYNEFDRLDQFLLDKEYKSRTQSAAGGIAPIFEVNTKEDQMSYESKSYLQRLGLAKLNKIFKKLREPFETDEKENIIDYNWHVDGILKNS